MKKDFKNFIVEKMCDDKFMLSLYFVLEKPIKLIATIEEIKLFLRSYI